MKSFSYKVTKLKNRLLYNTTTEPPSSATYKTNKFAVSLTEKKQVILKI